MKRTKLLLLILAILMPMMVNADPVAEYTDEQGVKYSLNNDGNTYSVSGYTDACTGDIIIPSSVNGCSVTSIGNSAFMNCYALSTITIPNSVTSIGQNAFSDCTSLALVNMEVETPIVITADVFTNADRVNAALHVPAGCKAAYADASIWKEFGTILPIEEEPIETIEADYNVVYLGHADNELSHEYVTLHVPVEVPQCE